MSRFVATKLLFFPVSDCDMSCVTSSYFRYFVSIIFVDIFCFWNLDYRSKTAAGLQFIVCLVILVQIEFTGGGVIYCYQ